MNIDTYIQDLRSRLADCPLTREQIAARAGGEISLSWLSKFAAGRADNPRVESLKALDAALTAAAQPISPADATQASSSAPVSS